MSVTPAPVEPSAPRKRYGGSWLPKPSLFVSWRPNGIGLQKPNHVMETLRTIWENRGNLRYAWRILSKGVCDGCALGVAGFKDWTIDGLHLCTTRLNLLQVNTARALDPARLADVAALRSLSSTELRALGRLPYPMLRMRGEAGFKRISWERALQIAGSQIKAAGPSRISFFLTARGIMNGRLADGSLVELVPDSPLDVPLHWQTARAASGFLDGLTRQMLAAARGALLPL